MIVSDATHTPQRYWSLLEGGEIDGETVHWADSHLTPTGVEDALAVNAFWKQALAVAKIPAPQKYYTSPLHRCCATANISFANLDLPASQPFVPQIREVSICLFLFFLVTYPFLP